MNKTHKYVNALQKQAKLAQVGSGNIYMRSAFRSCKAYYFGKKKKTVDFNDKKNIRFCLIYIHRYFYKYPFVMVSA